MRLRRPDRARVDTLLAGTAIGVYLLIVLGAATSVLDGAVACPTWPACHGRWLVGLDDPGLAVAWLHRLATLVVGVLLLATAVAARQRATRRVRAAVGLAVLLYPVQIGLGALTAVGGAPLGRSAAHLVVAMAIFTGILAALLWELDRGHPADPAGEATDTGAVEPADPPAAAPTGGLGRVGAYLRLTKPRLMWLLCLVALAAMGLAAGPALRPGRVAATLAGGVLAIGASGTFNNVLERERDRRMSRTADRPVVRGQVPVRRATAFGIALAAASVATFLAFVNVVAAALGALAILFYSVVYTLILKPNTTQNIVIGGAVGAFPALIGWAAVTRTVELPAVVLGAVIFLWTPAHFYNLALAYRDDYARAGFPMLPVVRGARITRRHVTLYLGATMAAAVVLGAITRLDLVYGLAVTVAGAGFLWAVVWQYRERTTAAALRTFHASNAYLGLLLAAVVVDAVVI
ncbi:MAG: heme o synthase [Halobacteriales archaeon]